MDMLFSKLTELAILSLLVSLTYGVKELVNYVKRRGKSEKYVLMTAIIDKIAYNVVAGLNQSVVDDLKAKSADGKLTKDEAMEIFTAALNSVNKQLPSEVLEVIEQEKLEDILMSVIERTVAEVK